jgi:hypothetical protein
LSLKDATNVYLLASAAAEFQELIHHYKSVLADGNESDTSKEKIYDVSKLEELSRVDTGLLIRKVGPLWRHAVILALALDLPHFKRDLLREPVPAEADPLIHFYEAFFAKVRKLGLDEAYLLKPLLNVSLSPIKTLTPL